MPTITLPPDMPNRMKRLRRDDVGRPVPWFVPWPDGKADFRMMTNERLIEAIKEQLCFICGQRLHRNHGRATPKGTFVAGPMCLVNRTSAEPPNHDDCATWSAKACPFLTKPGKERRETGIPEGCTLDDAAGIAIKRNPGVTALIECSKWTVWNASQVMGLGKDGLLFDMQTVTNVQWCAEGREATQSEVLTSIETGLPALVELAEAQPGAMAPLGRKMHNTLRWIGAGIDLDTYPTIARVLAAQP